MSWTYFEYVRILSNVGPKRFPNHWFGAESVICAWVCTSSPTSNNIRQPSERKPKAEWDRHLKNAKRVTTPNLVGNLIQESQTRCKIKHTIPPTNNGPPAQGLRLCNLGNGPWNMKPRAAEKMFPVYLSPSAVQLEPQLNQGIWQQPSFRQSEIVWAHV